MRGEGIFQSDAEPESKQHWPERCPERFQDAEGGRKCFQRKGIFRTNAEPESKQHWSERCPERFRDAEGGRKSFQRRGHLSDQCGTQMEVNREMMRKNYACLALAALLAFGGAAPVYAVEQEGRDGWKAEFTGKAIESNFTSSAFAEEISGLEPGDTIRIQIAVKNSSKKGTDWYMSNEVLESLEDASPAAGGAYQYELSYQGSGETKVLYSSTSVGGENVSGAGEGLHEASDSLEQFFYLDHLSGGKEGTITLVVGLNGETQVASYQNTLARLRLNFAVEETAGNGGGSSSGGGNGGGSPTPGSAVYSPGAVQTGDPGGMAFWSALALLSGLLLLVCAVVSMRRERREEQ